MESGRALFTWENSHHRVTEDGIAILGKRWSDETEEEFRRKLLREEQDGGEVGNLNFILSQEFS